MREKHVADGMGQGGVILLSHGLEDRSVVMDWRAVSFELRQELEGWCGWLPGRRGGGEGLPAPFAAWWGRWPSRGWVAGVGLLGAAAGADDRQRTGRRSSRSRR